MAGRAPDGTLFEFATMPNARWIDLLRERAESDVSPIRLATSLFQIFIMEHPFTDGNGRFSRALIYAAFARFGLIKTPCLGLNGVYEMHREPLSKALMECKKREVSEALFRSMLIFIEDSISLSEQNLSFEVSRLRSWEG